MCKYSLIYIGIVLWAKMTATVTVALFALAWAEKNMIVSILAAQYKEPSNYRHCLKYPGKFCHRKRHCNVTNP